MNSTTAEIRVCSLADEIREISSGQFLRSPLNSCIVFLLVSLLLIVFFSVVGKIVVDHTNVCLKCSSRAAENNASHEQNISYSHDNPNCKISNYTLGKPTISKGCKNMGTIIFPIIGGFTIFIFLTLIYLFCYIYQQRDNDTFSFQLMKRYQKYYDQDCQRNQECNQSQSCNQSQICNRNWDCENIKQGLNNDRHLLLNDVESPEQGVTPAYRSIL